MKTILACAFLAVAFALSAPASVHVPLEVAEGTAMRFARGVIAGVPCRFLVDTGATHTTFDHTFVTNRFPGVPLTPVQVTGRTNVRPAPCFLPVKRLQLGGQAIASPGAMVIPLDALRSSVGEPFDAILGMSDLSTVDFILRDRELVFEPTEEERRGFGPDARRGGDAYNPHVAGTHAGRSIAFLIDSASSHTFVREGLWPASTNETSFTATAITGRTDERRRIGERGTLDVGAPVALTPLLWAHDDNRLGADALKAADILFVSPGRRISFRAVR